LRRLLVIAGTLSALLASAMLGASPEVDSENRTDNSGRRCASDVCNPSRCNEALAAPTIANSNRLIAWLRAIDGLRGALGAA
jgi:hypothetical protein